MKTLKDYFERLSTTGLEPSIIQEVGDMRKMKITTQIDTDDREGLFNTVQDRWSRRAKHQLSHAELQSLGETSEFSKGDAALYEGNQVEVRIPIGPNGTAGVMISGHLRMIDRNKLMKIEEGVMGPVNTMEPLNRIIQLAGLEHSGTLNIEEPLAEEEITEVSGAGNMFDSLYKANLNDPRYKNNPNAAKLATIGSVLASMQSVIDELPEDLPDDVASQLKPVPGIGANLIKTAAEITKPVASGV
jgi:hypothetical protein